MMVTVSDYGQQVNMHNEIYYSIQKKKVGKSGENL